VITFYDSIKSTAIPRGATHVAGYADGMYAWSWLEIQLFPRHILISVLPAHPGMAANARVLDVERYAATPDDIVPFLRFRLSQGYGDGTIYGSLSIMPQIRAAIASDPVLVLGANCRLWAAAWGTDPASWTPANCDYWAVQYDSTPGYDASVLVGVDDFTLRREPLDM